MHSLQNTFRIKEEEINFFYSYFTYKYKKNIKQKYVLKLREN